MVGSSSDGSSRSDRSRPPSRIDITRWKRLVLSLIPYTSLATPASCARTLSLIVILESVEKSDSDRPFDRQGRGGSADLRTEALRAANLRGRSRNRRSTLTPDQGGNGTVY